MILIKLAHGQKLIHGAGPNRGVRALDQAMIMLPAAGGGAAEKAARAAGVQCGSASQLCRQREGVAL